MYINGNTLVKMSPRSRLFNEEMSLYVIGGDIQYALPVVGSMCFQVAFLMINNSKFDEAKVSPA